MMSANASAPPRLAGKARRKRSLISLTPLIDVVFILLVFFMLASSFLNWRAIDLNPPKKAGADAAMTGAMLVEVRADDLRLGGRSVGMTALAEGVADRLAEDPEQTVLVKPSQGASLQRTVTVLDRLSAEGVTNLSLIRDNAP